MAEELGTAVLRLEIDDEKAQKTINALRSTIEKFSPKFTGVEKGLERLASQAEVAKTRIQTLSQVLNQIPGASLNKITAQINRLTKESRDLTVQSEQYLKTLTRISELEFVRGARGGRQRVQADFEAARGPVLTRGFGATERLPELPETIAAYRQRLKELDFTLRNTAVGSDAFKKAQQEIIQVEYKLSEATKDAAGALVLQKDAAASAARAQQEAAEAAVQAQKKAAEAIAETEQRIRRLAKVDDGTERRLQKLAELQKYYSAQNQRGGGFRDPTTGALIARGAGATADERAYKATLRAAEQLLSVELKRAQLLRQREQALGRATGAREVSQATGFAAGFGVSDPIQKSIARNASKRAQQEARRTAQLDALDADLVRVREQRLAEERRLAKAARLGGPSTPIGGAVNIPGSPAFIAAQRRRRQDVVSNALIGGAFPLLFGQGVGAAAGGALGGGLGGKVGGQFGFGLSLVGTAVGAQFDAIIQKSAALGAALDNPIQNFSVLQQNALLSSKSLERQVEALIVVGREAEAAAIIQQDLANSYGGAAAARQLAEDQDRLNRSWTDLSLNLAQIALQPIADSLKGTADALYVFGEAVRFVRDLLPSGGRQQTTGGAILGAIPGAGTLNAIAPVTGLLPGANAEPLDFGNVLLRSIPGGGFASQLGDIFGGARAVLSGRQGEPTAGAVGVDQEKKRQALLSAQYRLIDAQVQGYKELAIERQKEVLAAEKALELDRIRANTKPGSAEQNIQLAELNKKFGQEEYKLNQELNQLKKDSAREQAVNGAKLAAQAQRNENERIANALTLRAEIEASGNALSRQIANAKQLAAAEGDVTRGVVQQRQAIAENAAAARDRLSVARAQYEAARLTGDEPGAERALAAQRQAAGELQLALISGADALTQAGKQLARDFSSAISSFTAIRADPQGLNRFLNPEQRGIRAQQDFQLLLPSFRRAQADFFQLTGVRAREFSGPTQTVNAAIRDFISAVDREKQAGINVVDIQRAIAKTNETLVKVNGDLATAVNTLAGKDWNVQVNVAADGTSQTFGDALAGAIS